ncbi:conserved hypothetical protein [Solidesulfovibrio fructosivorans JJ]]|uniref:Lipoprotein n=1 Tax=Solidesulfovibrio fructosivorans JJ] TaxID=596151 RepID=E1JZM6_SOLFR|nr:hypothetical protein [Solidesulfovibrio fructosivorans]EFL50161.1 conserved hypothetical protein [Solidesulfovibrio fructosivorans JJ]]
MLRRLAASSCLVVTALLSLGCAGSGPKSDNVSQQTLDADYRDCESRAYVSTALIQSPGEAADKQEAILDACMKEKGYKVK